MNGTSGMDILSKAKEVLPDAEVIVVTGHGTVESAVTAEVEAAAEEALASRTDMPDGASAVEDVYGEWPDTEHPGPAPFY